MNHSVNEPHDADSVSYWEHAIPRAKMQSAKKCLSRCFLHVAMLIFDNFVCVTVMSELKGNKFLNKLILLICVYKQ